MRIFKIPWFSHFSYKENISDQALMHVVSQLEEGYLTSISAAESLSSGCPKRDGENPPVIV
ncbi:MAG: type II toxin-antitoxin system RelE/ParE family toxin [Candidatus Adiutrix sp.]|jgi:hypothetical protein|nr:type II toxin-antitoxin system RelE/ParE family toxin [Candidatus Adiutrix sp.]